MPFDNWTKDAQGNLTVQPVAGWDIGTAMTTALIVRLSLMKPGDQVDHPSDAVQIVLTPHQAIELAQVLSNNAEKLIGMKPTGYAS